MKRVSLLCTVAAAAAFMSPSAKADLFRISFTDAPVSVSGSGVFNAVNDGGGVYTITQVLSGSVTDPITGTAQIVGLSSFGGADELLDFPSATYFDDNGLSFLLSNGLSVNLYDDAVAGEAEVRSDGQAEPATFAVSVAATPEPSSFVLLGTAALAGMGEMVRRRRSVA